MVKTKFIAIVAAAALAAMLGLSACSGQAASSKASSASASSAAASSAAASSSAATSSSAAASTSAAAVSEDTIISWQGVLVDGSLVDYISSDDGAHGGFVITKEDGKEPKRWLGTQAATEDGMVTITDDETKEAISFNLTGATKEGAVLIDVAGYGKGALVPMTADDWKTVAEAEELAKALGTVVNSVGVFEDGSLIFYTENQEGTDAIVVVAPKNSTETKTWSGKATTAENGKETVTDDKTQETFNYTWTENPEDGTITIIADGYGKATLVKMDVADWLILEELAQAANM